MRGNIGPSIKFIPIHRFRPSINTISPGKVEDNGFTDNNKYGKEKYIALSDGDPKDGYYNSSN